MSDVALLERYRDGGISVFDGLIQSFNESKAVIGNVSMSFEDIAKVLDISRNRFIVEMSQYIEAVQDKTGDVIYERNAERCLSGKGRTGCE